MVVPIADKSSYVKVTLFIFEEKGKYARKPSSGISID
jgi:hypothetical protein